MKMKSTNRTKPTNNSKTYTIKKAGVTSGLFLQQKISAVRFFTLGTITIARIILHATLTLLLLVLAWLVGAGIFFALRILWVLWVLLRISHDRTPYISYAAATCHRASGAT